ARQRNHSSDPLMSARSAANAVCLGIVVLLSTPWVRASENPGEVVAKLGETDVDAKALQPFIKALDPLLRKQALANPEVMNRLAGLELARMAVLKEAEARRWQERPEVARRVARAKEDAIFASYIAEVAAVAKDYPSDAEIAQAYEQNRDAFMSPR